MFAESRYQIFVFYSGERCGPISRTRRDKYSYGEHTKRVILPGDFYGNGIVDETKGFSVSSLKRRAPGRGDGKQMEAASRELTKYYFRRTRTRLV